LVHACLEGPEAGVYYRGKSKIKCNNETIVELPKYVDKIANNFSVHLTPIGKPRILSCSEVIDNKFSVYGENGSFYWIVYGQRLNIDVEINKEGLVVKGDGPYTYIQ